MQFTNATIFSFADMDKSTLQELEKHLPECVLKPVGPLEVSSRGFIPPMGREDEALAYRTDDAIWLAIGGEDRILPPAVVSRELERKIAEITEKEGRAPGSRTRRRIKDEVVTELIPKAFIKPSRTDVYINTRLGICVVDTASRKTAESAVSMIRRALGSFPALPSNAEVAPSSVLADLFLAGNDPLITLGDEIELKDPAGEGTIRASREDLHNQDLRKHMEAGKRVTRLGLNLGESSSFVMGEDLTLRKIRFHTLGEALEEKEVDSLRMELATRFEVFHHEFSAIYCKLAQLFRLTGAAPLFDGHKDFSQVLLARVRERLGTRASMTNDNGQLTLTISAA